MCQATGHPKMITHLDAFTGANLEFLLSRRDFGIRIGDIDSGEEASLVVGLDNVVLDNFATIDIVVVRSLESWEAIDEPVVKTIVQIQEVYSYSKPNHDS